MGCLGPRFGTPALGSLTPALHALTHHNYLRANVSVKPLPSCQELPNPRSRCPVLQWIKSWYRNIVVGISEGCSRYKIKETNTNRAWARWICVYSTQTYPCFTLLLKGLPQTITRPDLTQHPAWLSVPHFWTHQQLTQTQTKLIGSPHPASNSHPLQSAKICFLGIRKQPFWDLFI